MEKISILLIGLAISFTAYGMEEDIILAQLKSQLPKLNCKLDGLREEYLATRKNNPLDSETANKIMTEENKTKLKIKNIQNYIQNCES